MILSRSGRHKASYESGIIQTIGQLEDTLAGLNDKIAQNKDAPKELGNKIATLFEQATEELQLLESITV